MAIDVNVMHAILVDAMAIDILHHAISHLQYDAQKPERLHAHN
jgi:hypothetical protein